MFPELAIQPTLNASLLPRNPNDAPSNAGQSSSQPSAAAGTETSSNQQSLNQSDITIQSNDSTTVKADASQQVQASTMG